MDGLYGMDLTEELQKLVLAECYAALRTGGTIIFTDYLRPERFREMEERIRQSPFKIVDVHYLHDRLWYQVESWFHLLEGQRWVKALLRSTSFAQLLKIPSRLFGKYGSRHICIVATKP
jgi:SAM-dependent methyltransferase